MTAFADPTNDFFDVTTFPYDIEAVHGGMARHAYVVDIGAGTRLLNMTPAAGTARNLVCVTNGEHVPGWIKSIDAATTVVRVRIFFD